MVIRTNIHALNAHRNMGKVAIQKARASQRLSSGYRINTASDDAAGLAISEKMRAQIRGLEQAARNAQDAINLIQTAEGGIATINDKLQRIRELIVYAANDTHYFDANNISQSDRAKIQDEINQLLDEIDAVSKRVQFNNKTLLSGKYGRGGGAVASVTPDPTILVLPTALQLIDDILGILNSDPVAVPVQPLSTPPPTPPPARQIDLSNPISSFVPSNGWRIDGNEIVIYGGGDFQISGTTANYRIRVDGTNPTNVILNNANIETDTGAALDMRGATVDLWIEGNNSLVTTAAGFAGIQTTEGVLLINGNGYLLARGGNHGAGIGGGMHSDGGNVTILSGNIHASTTGVNSEAAGIGGGSPVLMSDAYGNIVSRGGNAGNITILGGNIIAESTWNGASIGGGVRGSGGNIVINGGNITTVRAGYDGHIGAGFNGNSGQISINGGHITSSSIGGFGAVDTRFIEPIQGSIIITDGIVITHAIVGYTRAC